MSTTTPRPDDSTGNLSVGSATLPSMTNTTHPTLPIPVGATRIDDWDRDGRMFYGSAAATIEASGWLREPVTVETGGLQNVDGSYEWLIWAGAVHPDNPLTAAQARQFGEALIAAAEELEQLGVEAVGR
jgi:hypothetical protein